MSDLTHLLEAASTGDPRAAADLLPLVYDELRKLAIARMTAEPAGQTLQPTALVHEAYLRLVRGEQPQDWDGRGHFFAAAAEAMRRIMVEKARRRRRIRHGGNLRRQSLDGLQPADEASVDKVDLIALSDALDQLESASSRRAQLVKLRYFAGLTLPEAAALLGVSRSTAEADWTYAKAWLKREMEKN
jgi:RNA polymerase sigma factor (TIGR02999 family)